MSASNSDIFVLKTRKISRRGLVESDIDNEYASPVFSVDVPDEVESKPGAFNYSAYRDSGLLNAYRSSTVPIEVGCLKLNLDSIPNYARSGPTSKSGKSNIRVAWNGNSAPTDDGCHLDPETLEQRQTSMGSSGSSVNHANTRAMIHRRQGRRLRLSRKEGTGLKSLRLFLSVLYYTGVSPYRPKTTWAPHVALVRVQKVTHWIFVSLAILDGIWRGKQQWIEFRLSPSMQAIALLGISIIYVITRIYSVRVFATMRTKMDRVLYGDPANDDHLEGKEQLSTSTIKLKIVLLVLFTLSVCMAVAYVIFGAMPFQTWTFDVHQRTVAQDVNEFIAIWTPNNWENVTADLTKQYAHESSPSLIIFAAMGDTMSYTGNLYDNLMIDFWLVLSYHVYDLQADLQRFLDHRDISLALVDLDGVWKMYMECRTPIEEINDIFDPLLKLVHVTNILGLSWLLLDSVENSISAWRLCQVFNILKTAMAYKFCWSSSQTNGKLQKVITRKVDTNGLVELNGKKVNIYVLRIQLKDHKIGLGSGDFMIEETFLLKVLCAAWSMFALFADQKEPCSKMK